MHINRTLTQNTNYLDLKSETNLAQLLLLKNNENDISEKKKRLSV